MSAICYPTSTDYTCLTEEQRTSLDLPDNAAAKERAEMFAWTGLQTLTGYRLDICPVVVRPCSAGCWGGREQSYIAAPVTGIGQPFAPYVFNGAWFNSCGCRDTCNCGPTMSQVLLPGPIGAIAEVKVDGQVVPASAYRVDNSNRLVRLDGEAWPSCQNMALAPTEEGTFSVAYYRGFAPNALVDYAAGVLAWEFFLSCTGERGCRLPSGVTSVVRQGVTLEIDREFWTNGKSGIDEVDRIVAGINPQGLRQPPMIVSPESLAAAPRRTSWAV